MAWVLGFGSLTWLYLFRTAPIHIDDFSVLVAILELFLALAAWRTVRDLAQRLGTTTTFRIAIKARTMAITASLIAIISASVAIATLVVPTRSFMFDVVTMISAMMLAASVGDTRSALSDAMRGPTGSPSRGGLPRP